MASFEHGSEHLSPPNRAEIIHKTQNDLAELGQEVRPQPQLPKAVLDLVKTYLPEDLQEDGGEAALSLQADNPDIFKVPDTVLPIILGAALREVEINAKRNNLMTEKADNASRNKEIDALSDAVALEEISQTNPKLKTLRGADLLEALLTHEFVEGRPHLTERLNLIKGQFEAIRRVAATPEEAAALDNILSAAPLYFGAETIDGVFADVLTAADNAPDISEDTKVNIHKLFNIPTVKTAGDLQSILQTGYGTDANGEKIAIGQNEKLRVFPNSYLYELPDGDRLFDVHVPGNRLFKVKFGADTKESHLTDSILATQTIAVMAQIGLAESIWNRGWSLQSGGVLDLSGDDIIKAKRILGILAGGNTGYDNYLVNGNLSQEIMHRIQAFPRKGDAAFDNNDPASARADYQELTIIDAQGNFDWQQFEKAAHYLHDVTRKGGQPNFEGLKACLTRAIYPY